MAIRATDFAVLVVDLEFGPLVPTNAPSELLRLVLGVSDVARSLSAVPLDLPAAVLVWHHAMGVSCHEQSPFLNR